MSETLLHKLDLAHHGRLLRRLLGGSEIAACDGSGEVVWAGEPDREGGIRSLLAALQQERGDLFEPDGGAGRVELAGGRQLLYAPVYGAAAQAVVWLAALVNPDAAPDPEALAESVVDVAAALSRELRMHDEIEGLAEELSARHEELNLVYSLEAQTRALDRGDLGAHELLADFADALAVDLAVFTLAGQPSPIWALRGAPLPDLDLVLTTLRGQLFPFLALHRRPLILNECDDIRREYFLVNMSYRVIACPVENEGGVEAMLALVRRDDRPFFTNGDRNLTKVIAAQMALALRNRRMLSGLRRFGEQLAGALIEAIEAKDPYTRGHSERVQGIATRIGSTSGLTSRDVEDISWGALLHDVGKIGIPDRVLCKAGRLTQEEYTLVKVHAERSYQILRHIEQIGRNAVETARYHHERFDGSGYPQGLRGYEIPRHARVTSVADTYDAITSSRAYRPGLSHEEAMSRISEVSGSQLDPQYVRVFEAMCAEDRSWLEDLTKPLDPDHG